MKKEPKGFTLVELSIVLVIIGLLIGGVLVAQSMIRTAQINGMVQQIGEYDIAVSNFRTKYNGLPGDTVINFGYGSGDGDKRIDEDSFSGTNDLGRFWADLSKAENMKTSYNILFYGTDIGSEPITNYAPQFNITQGKSAQPALFAATRPNGTHYFVYQYYHADVPGSLDWTYAQPLRPGDALAFDTKIDDGIMSSGSVARGGVAAGWTATDADECITASGDWDASKSGFACSLEIRFGIVTGVR